MCNKISFSKKGGTGSQNEEQILQRLEININF